MKSNVFFSDLKVGSGKTLLDKLDILLGSVRSERKDQGEGPGGHQTPFRREREYGLCPAHLFKKDRGSGQTIQRKTFLDRYQYPLCGNAGGGHLPSDHCLSRTGLSTSVVDAPLLIADGLRGNSAVNVRIDKPLFKTVSIAHAIYMADALISVAHFKGHELSGFGGTLKNLGMGCASREGKLSQHSNISPQVKGKTCKGCELCLNCVPPRGDLHASTQAEHRKQTDASRSSIPRNASAVENVSSPVPQAPIQIQWNETIPIFQKKMVEHAYGAVQKKKGKVLYLNFLTQISPACDCYGFSDTPIVNDIGILCL